jgi:integrase
LAELRQRATDGCRCVGSDHSHDLVTRITAYLGHASIQTTFDLYGHLMPGNEEEAVALVNAYLE